MASPLRIKTHLFWTLTALTFVAALGTMVVYAPQDETMGPIQKVFYLHLPAAFNTFAACSVVFVASVAYLWQRSLWWDDLASAAGKVAALMCGVVLITGMVWARSVWGEWWLWTPRLTFSLILLLLYVGYIVLRMFVTAPRRRAAVSAVYGLVAFLDVPIVYLSVRLMPDVHPVAMTLNPGMRLTLLAWIVPVSLLMVGLIQMRFNLNRRQRRLTATPSAVVGSFA